MFVEPRVDRINVHGRDSETKELAGLVVSRLNSRGDESRINSLDILVVYLRARPTALFFLLLGTIGIGFPLRIPANMNPPRIPKRSCLPSGEQARATGRRDIR